MPSILNSLQKTVSDLVSEPEKAVPAEVVDSYLGGAGKRYAQAPDDKSLTLRNFLFKTVKDPDHGKLQIEGYNDYLYAPEPDRMPEGQIQYCDACEEFATEMAACASNRRIYPLDDQLAARDVSPLARAKQVLSQGTENAQDSLDSATAAPILKEHRKNPSDVLPYLTRVRREQLEFAGKIFASYKRLNCSTVPLRILRSLTKNAEGRQFLERVRTCAFGDGHTAFFRRYLMDHPKVLMTLYQAIRSENPWKRHESDENVSLADLRRTADIQVGNSMPEKRFCDPQSDFLPYVTRSLREHGVQGLNELIGKTSESQSITYIPPENMSADVFAQVALLTPAGRDLLNVISRGWQPRISCDDEFIHRAIVDAAGKDAFRVPSECLRSGVITLSDSLKDITAIYNGAKGDMTELEVWGMREFCAMMAANEENLPYLNFICLHVNEDGTPIYHDDRELHRKLWNVPFRENPQLKAYDNLVIPDGFFIGEFNHCQMESLDYQTHEYISSPLSYYNRNNMYYDYNFGKINPIFPENIFDIIKLENYIGAMNADGEFTTEYKEASEFLNFTQSHSLKLLKDHYTQFYQTALVAFYCDKDDRKRTIKIDYNVLKNEFFKKWYPQLLNKNNITYNDVKNIFKKWKLKTIEKDKVKLYAPDYVFRFNDGRQLITHERDIVYRDQYLPEQNAYQFFKKWFPDHDVYDQMLLCRPEKDAVSKEEWVKKQWQHELDRTMKDVGDSYKNWDVEKIDPEDFSVGLNP